MLYLSELLGKPVHWKGSTKVGTLTDLVFVSSEIPYITKLHVKTPDRKTTLYPVSAIKKTNGVIELEKVDSVPFAENEASLVKNILDQQVIDIRGKNVVRVNDVVIQERPSYAISGLDIGWTGILRWFRLEDLMTSFLRKPIRHTLLPWSDIQPLEVNPGKVVLSKEETKLKTIAPEDLADYLEKTTIHNAMKILSMVSQETASEVIQNLNINYQTQIFRQMNPETAATIVTYADPDEAADLLLTVSEEKQEHILSLVPPEKKKELTFLLSHAESAIGELMTTEFILFQPEDSVRTVMNRIKKETAGFDTLPYVYIANKRKELIGVISLHELLLQPDNLPILRFMNQNVIVIHLTTPRTSAIKRMLKYRLRAIPVINNNREIIGMVTLDDLVEPILEKM